MRYYVTPFSKSLINAFYEDVDLGFMRQTNLNRFFAGINLRKGGFCNFRGIIRQKMLKHFKLLKL